MCWENQLETRVKDGGVDMTKVHFIPVQNFQRVNFKKKPTAF